jgi:hypothetical protein
MFLRLAIPIRSCFSHRLASFSRRLRLRCALATYRVRSRILRVLEHAPVTCPFAWSRLSLDSRTSAGRRHASVALQHGGWSRWWSWLAFRASRAVVVGYSLGVGWGGVGVWRRRPVDTSRRDVKVIPRKPACLSTTVLKAYVREQKRPTPGGVTDAVEPLSCVENNLQLNKSLS